MKLKQRLAIGYIQTKFKVLTAFSSRKAAEKAFDLFCTPYLKVKRKGHPPQAETIRFRLDPGKGRAPLNIHGYRWNHPAPKRILILHGFGSAAFKFEHYVPGLTRKGYEVLAIDAPAHGKSEGKRTNAVEYRAMIREVIRRFGPINGYIAHSFGGIALCLALEEEADAGAVKVVLIAPATETTSAIDGAFRMLKVRDESVRREFDRIILEHSGKPAEWYSIRRAIGNICASILWIHDEEDEITPFDDALKVKEDDHAHVEFFITKGLGHQKIYRDENVKKRVIEFL